MGNTNCCSAVDDSENIVIGGYMQNQIEPKTIKLYWTRANATSRAVKSLLVAGNIPHEE